MMMQCPDEPFPICFTWDAISLLIMFIKFIKTFVVNLCCTISKSVHPSSFHCCLFGFDDDDDNTVVFNKSKCTYSRLLRCFDTFFVLMCCRIVVVVLCGVVVCWFTDVKLFIFALSQSERAKLIIHTKNNVMSEYPRGMLRYQAKAINLQPFTPFKIIPSLSSILVGTGTGTTYHSHHVYIIQHCLNQQRTSFTK